MPSFSCCGGKPSIIIDLVEGQALEMIRKVFWCEFFETGQFFIALCVNQGISSPATGHDSQHAKVFKHGNDE